MNGLEDSARFKETWRGLPFPPSPFHKWARGEHPFFTRVEEENRPSLAKRKRGEVAFFHQMEERRLWFFPSPACGRGWSEGPGEGIARLHRSGVSIDKKRATKKLAAALQGCRSNSIGKGFASPPQWLRSKPRPSGRSLNLRTVLKAGVSNRSQFSISIFSFPILTPRQAQGEQIKKPSNTKIFPNHCRE